MAAWELVEWKRKPCSRMLKGLGGVALRKGEREVKARSNEACVNSKRMEVKVKIAAKVNGNRA